MEPNIADNQTTAEVQKIDPDEPLRILIVEKDPMDTLIIRKALGEDRRNFKIHHIQNGIEAVDYLRNKDNVENTLPPDLIILDENVPSLNAYQIMETLKYSPELRKIPVIVIQKNNDRSTTTDKYTLLANQFLKQNPKVQMLSPFIHVIHNHFKNKKT